MSPANAGLFFLGGSMESNYYVEIPKSVENLQLPDPGLL
jgi:hypothetical protein